MTPAQRAVAAEMTEGEVELLHALATVGPMGGTFDMAEMHALAWFVHHGLVQTEVRPSTMGGVLAWSITAAGREAVAMRRAH